MTIISKTPLWQAKEDIDLAYDPLYRKYFDLTDTTPTIKGYELKKFIFDKDPNWLKSQPENRIIVNELPLGVDEYGNLVTIPQSTDTQVIGITGVRSMGKSVLAASLLCADWALGNRCVVANDIQFDSKFFSKPAEWRLEELGAVGLYPHWLPVFHIWINADPKTADQKGEASSFDHIKMAIPFTDFLKNPDKFEVDFEGSDKYFVELLPELCKLNSWQEIEEYVTNHKFMVGGVVVDKRDSKKKILTVLKQQIDTGIFDIGTTGKTTEAIVLYRGQETKLPPVLALLECGAIPSIITRPISTNRNFSSIFCYVVDQIFKYQRYFQKTTINLYIDELNLLITKKDRKRPLNLLIDVIAGGRPMKLGVVWCAQNPSKIKDKMDEVFSNTTYHCIFNNELSELRVILPDAQLRDKVHSLSKHQFLLSTVHKIRIWDHITGESELHENPEPMVLTAIPPFCRTRKPGE